MTGTLAHDLGAGAGEDGGDLLAGEPVGELDVGGDQHLGGAEVDGFEVGDGVDLGHGLEPLPEPHDVALGHGLVGQQRAVAAGQRGGEVAEQQADRDRGERVRERGAGPPVQHERDQGEQRPEHVDGVLEVDGHDRRVGALAEQLADRELAPRGLGPELAEGDGPAQPVEHERDQEHRDADPERLQLGRVDERADAVPDRDGAADDEDADGGEQRPVVPLGPVAEGVRGVGRPAAAPDRDVEQHLVAGVGDGVQRLGQQRGRPGEHRGDPLRHGDRGVGRERGGHALDALVGSDLWFRCGDAHRRRRRYRDASQ